METDELNEKLRQARKGDADAFAAIFESFRPLVFSVAVRLVGSSDADDVVMESYLKAWKALPNFSGLSALKTWLFRIAYNCAQDQLRSRGRRREEPLPVNEDGEPVEIRLERHASPADLVMRNELGTAIERCMAQLPPLHRTTLLLRFADGMSYQEIAAATGVSLGTVMSRIFNGRRKLQALLRATESPSPGKARGTAR